MKVNWIGIILSFVLTFAFSDAIDRTKTDRATGSDVVQSVVDTIAQRCIFPNERMFIRRMAFVETEDGADSSTFRPGFYGGIWQITNRTYQATRLCKDPLHLLCKAIKTQFNIDWQKTSWKDLLKPFYSGLAAHLALVLSKQAISGDPANQEKIWETVFHSKSFNHTRNFSEVSKTLSSSCNGKADLVFLLDESGSVRKRNFDKVKEFLVKTTKRLTIGPNNIRVSLVKFGRTTTVVSYLNQLKSYPDVVKAINGMKYLGGGTPTDAGLNIVTNSVFSAKNGAKETKDAPRVLVLVTDGQSNNKPLTVAAANNAKAHKIDIFSVGVGSGINYDELRRVASKCNHVFTLANFDDFNNFIYELTKETCKAKAHVTVPKATGNNTDSGSIKIVEKITGDKVKRGVVVDPDPTNSTEGRTIVVESNCAVVKVYGSHNNENPSESMFEITGTSIDGRPIVLFVKTDKDGKPLFLSFEATKLNNSAKVCSNSSFVVRINRGKPKVGEVVCEENGVLRNCTTVDLIESKWGDKICPRASDIANIGSNPCTEENLRAKKLYFPYPNDNTKFLKCDMKGRVYVIICPVGLFYEPGRDSCGTDSVVPDTKKPLGGKSPCTHKNFLQHQVYFPYLPNHHYYVQCDQWNAAWVVPCPDEDIWDQKVLQCIPENAEQKGNPCKAESIKKGIFFFPYPGDKHKYIHCTDNHNFVIQSCGEMVYDDTVHNCLPG